MSNRRTPLIRLRVERLEDRSAPTDVSGPSAA
jgi:hypothetical protein